MSKNKKKQSKLSIHPVHFHIGLYVVVAALLITAMKSSEGIIASIYNTAHQGEDMLSNTHMRQAETHIGHAQLSFARLTHNSGT